MKVTVCQLNDETEALEEDWGQLVSHVRDEGSDLVLLPEMPFHPWLATTPEASLDAWQAAVNAHDLWLERLPELAPAVVLGSRPVVAGGRCLNEGFVWAADAGYCPVHTKYYLPDDEGFWEASWYERGDGTFEPIVVAGAKIGLQICTELWFMERARAYGKSGIHLLACPRATELATIDKWLTGGRAAAVISGAFCLSSNRTNPPDRPVCFGGQGWIIDPDGEVLALTTREQPFVTREIDLSQAVAAKQTYPRYVLD